MRDDGVGAPARESAAPPSPFAARQHAGIALDLVAGPGSTGRYINVYPLIADFLTEDRAAVEARKDAIDAREWDRCSDLADEVRERRGHRSRDGNPVFSNNPA